MCRGISCPSHKDRELGDLDVLKIYLYFGSRQYNYDAEIRAKSVNTDCCTQRVL